LLQLPFFVFFSLHKCFLRPRSIVFFVVISFLNLRKILTSITNLNLKGKMARGELTLRST
jgi:hypothetical protein